MLVATAAVHLRDPHVEGSWGLCPLRALTGWDCPGCGGLRATHDLTHLDLWSAASSNLLLVLAIPLVLLGWGRWLSATWRGAPSAVAGLSDRVVVALIAAILGFTLLRNLPVGAWLAS